MKNLLLLFQFFPLVLQTVMAVETATGSQPGTSKKELALTAVLTAAKIGESVDQSTVKAIATLIDDVVTNLNKSGVFASKPIKP